MGSLLAFIFIFCSLHDKMNDANIERYSKFLLIFSNEDEKNDYKTENEKIYERNCIKIKTNKMKYAFFATFFIFLTSVSFWVNIFMY